MTKEGNKIKTKTETETDREKERGGEFGTEAPKKDLSFFSQSINQSIT